MNNFDVRSIEDYKIGSLLGRGGFAKVFHALDKVNNREVAIKFISKSLLNDDISIRDRVSNEIRIHLQLNHHAIVKVLNYFEDSDHVYIVLELCVNGNLYKYLRRGRLDEAVAAKYCVQILEALQYLQSSQVQVIHRDLKLSNILLDENFDIKLCDFGLATQLEHPDEEQYTVLGTPNYIAPEVVGQTAHGFPADIWSLGCLLFAMLTGDTPFEQRGGGGGGEVRDTLQRVVDGHYTMPTNISQMAQSFLRSLLRLDPSSRLTVTQALQDPFLLSHSRAATTPITTKKNLMSSNNWNDDDVQKSYSLKSPSSVHRELERYPNESFAATTLVSYDGRTFATTDADNRTTVNDGNDAYSDDDKNERHGDDGGVSHADESTYDTADLRPQQLRLRPEKQLQYSYDDTEGMLERSESPSSSSNQHRRHQHENLLRLHSDASVAPNMVTPPPVALTSDNMESLFHRFDHGQDGQDSNHNYADKLFSPLAKSPMEYSPLVTSQSQMRSRSRLLPHRQSYPPPSNQDHVPSSHTQHGHFLLDTLGGRAGHSLTLSLDSSLHCASLPSTPFSAAGSGQLTSNSSMSSADCFEFSRSGSMHSVSSRGSRSSGRASSDVLNSGSIRCSRWSRHKPDGRIRPTAGSSRRLWVPPRPRNSKGSVMKGMNDAASSQAFCYCAPRGDVLIVSKGGDVVYLTYLRDKSNKLRPCRLSVRAEKPLMLLVGKVTKHMCREIKDIIALSQEGNAFSLPSEDSSAGSAGDGLGEVRERDVLERSNGGGFIGKESFPEQELDILSDTAWLSSYHVTKLPVGLKKTYDTVARMLEAVKCKLPKLILYLTEKESTGYIHSPQDTSRGDPSTGEKAVCKCMIMCNNPLPDFSVRWSDGTKLRYRLSDGKLRITNNQGDTKTHYTWDGIASTDADWTTSAPQSIRKYLLLAQSAMRRCIAEDIKLQRELDDNDVNNSCPDERRVTSYPLIVVESIENT